MLVPQSVFGLAQGTLQVPLVQVWAPVQAWPQLPQFWLSVCLFTHEPEQLVSVPQPVEPVVVPVVPVVVPLVVVPVPVVPVEVVLATHAPALQTWFEAQALLHAPQSEWLV